MALDIGTYGGYEQHVRFDLEGAHIHWSDIPPQERATVSDFVHRQHAVLARHYNIRIDTAPDFSWIRLNLRHRSPATPADVADLKGRMFTLVMLTSWGGPG